MKSIFLLHDLTAGSRIFIQSSQKYSCVSKERKFGHRKIPYSRIKVAEQLFLAFEMKACSKNYESLFIFS